MVTSRTVVGLIVCLAAGLIGFFVFYQTDAEKIRNRLEILAERVSKEGTENKLTAAANAKKIADLFTDPCVLKLPQTPYETASGEFSRQDIRSYAMAGRSQYQRIKLDVYDISITFNDRRTADVRLTARIRAGQDGGRPVDEYDEFVCRFKNVQEQWYISRMAAVEVLER